MAKVLEDLLIRIGVSLNAGSLDSLDRKLKKSENTSKSLGLNLRGLTGLLAGFGVTFGTAELVKGMVDFDVKLGAIESRFEAVTGSVAGANKEMQFLKRITKEYGQDMTQSADAFSLFFASAKSQLGGDQAEKVFENWSRVSRVLHMSPEAMEGTFYALREMIGKQKIYTSELARQIGTHVPNAVPIAAKAMGFMGKNGKADVKGFYQAVKDGQIDVNQFVMKFSQAMQDTYGNNGQVGGAMKKLDAKMGGLKNTWWNLLYALDKGGVGDRLGAGVGAIARVLEKIEPMIPAINAVLDGTIRTVQFLVPVVKMLALLFIGGAITKGAGGVIRVLAVLVKVITMLKGGVPLAWILKYIANGRILAVLMNILKIFGLSNPWMAGITIIITILLPLAFKIVKDIFNTVQGNISSYGTLGYRIVMWFRDFKDFLHSTFKDFFDWIDSITPKHKLKHYDYQSAKSLVRGGAMKAEAFKDYDVYSKFQKDKDMKGYVTINDNKKVTNNFEAGVDEQTVSNAMNYNPNNPIIAQNMLLGQG